VTPEEWQKIKEVLQEAMELDRSQHAAFLDSACAGQTSLRGEVESLLLSYQQDQSFLERPLAAAASGLVTGAVQASWIGRRLGPYQVLEEIGEGGMGAVYRAVRADGMYDKEVAIKLIRTGLTTDFFASRFRIERRILAGLDHPNIARLLDGGVTEEGLPYVVLELVTGVPIDEYCQKHTLSITERLKLFRTVCSAVQYLHQNLIVHRDLKPGNILVSGDGVPKLLDFGIAKILDAQHDEMGASGTLTVMGMMTPDFASPEQIRGELITTASDVYSLGVLLYVLLTGQRPYRVASSAPHEIVKAICETEPEKPSSAAVRVPMRDEEAESDSGNRIPSGLDVEGERGKIRRALVGDLDSIVLKALRKEPPQRYATVEQFSDDVRSHLENLPVAARKGTTRYRATKFFMRHKAGVGAGTAVAIVLLTGILLILREARLAERRFNDVRSLANSLIFDVHDSIKDLPGSTPARKLIVDRALKYLDSLAQESGGDLALQRELATAYERVGLVQGHYLQNNLGDTQGSLQSYQKALQIRQQIDARSRDWNDRLALADAYHLVANQQWATGDKFGAKDKMDKAVAIAEALNTAHPNDVKILKELGFDYEIAAQVGNTGRPGEAAKADENERKSLAVSEALLRLVPDDLEVQHGYAVELSHIGSALEATDTKTALEYHRKELEIEQKLHQQSPDIRYARGLARAYGEISRTYSRNGDLTHTLEYDMRDLTIYQELVRVDPQNALRRRGLAIAYVNTASDFGDAGRAPQSLSYMEKGVEMMRALVASSPQNADQRGILGAIYGASASNLMKLHRPEQALKEFNKACAMQEAASKADPGDQGASINTAFCVKRMGEAAAEAGNARLAASYFHRALRVVEPLVSAPVPDLDALYTAADAYSGLGDLQLHEARRPGEAAGKRKANWTEARAWYRKSLDAWRRIQHPLHIAPNGGDVGDPAKVARNLQLCETALSVFNRSSQKPAAGLPQAAHP
jgi:eukaryotic-like serine/threonine-protein kinase